MNECSTAIGRGHGRSKGHLQTDFGVTQSPPFTSNSHGSVIRSVRTVDDKIVLSINRDQSCNKDNLSYAAHTKKNKTARNSVRSVQREQTFRCSVEVDDHLVSGEYQNQAVCEELLETAVSKALTSSCNVFMNQQDNNKNFLSNLPNRKDPVFTPVCNTKTAAVT